MIIWLVATSFWAAAFADRVNCYTRSPLVQQTEELKAIPQQQVRSRSLGYAGVDSWAASLRILGVAKTNRAASPAEFWHWMRSEHCQLLSPKDEILAGDVSVAFAQGRGPIVSYVNVGQNQAFYKRNGDAGSPFEMISTSELVQRLPKPHRRVTYRCELTEDLKPPRDLEPIGRQIDVVETQMIALYERGFSQALNPTLEKLSLLLSQVREKKLSPDLEFWRKALEFRILGLLSMQAKNTSGLSPTAETAVKDADQTLRKLNRLDTPLDPRELSTE